MNVTTTKRETATVALRKTARVTGSWYLALAISGILGFLLIRPRIYVVGDATATLANLIEHAALARTGLVLEMAVVVTQALAAVWFYKLFRSINNSAAWALAAFGMANAIAVMASTVFMATALTVVSDVGLAPGGDRAATIQLMYQLSSESWGVGAVFFGLWLIPMGYIALGSTRMPKWLGRILILGGFGYGLSAFEGYGIASAPAWVLQALTVPATVGEFGMIGYLLFRGIRPVGDTETSDLEQMVSSNAARYEVRTTGPTRDGGKYQLVYLRTVSFPTKSRQASTDAMNDRSGHSALRPDQVT